MKLLTGKILSVVFLLNLLFLTGAGIVSGANFQPGLNQDINSYHSKACGLQNSSFIAEEIEFDEEDDDGEEKTDFFAIHSFDSAFSSIIKQVYSINLVSKNYPPCTHINWGIPFFILNCVFII